MGNFFGCSPCEEHSISNSPGASAAGKSRHNSRSGLSVNSGSAGEFFEEGCANGGLVEKESNGEIPETPNIKVFIFADLRNAPKNFKQENLLGEGGFGRVFKGWVDEKNLAPSKMGNGMLLPSRS